FVFQSNELLEAFRFGHICSVQMVSDILLIILNTFWCLVIPYRAEYLLQSRVAMVVGVISKSLYFFTCKLHVLMAVNRFCFIFFFKENPKTTKIFKGAIVVCASLATLQSAVGPLLDSKLFVVFSSVTLRWMFATTEWTPFYEAYFEYYVVLTECSTIIVLDSLSFFKLRSIHRQVSGSQKAAAREMRLLLQSFCQLIPLSTVMVFFFFVAPNCASEFVSFLCSTAVWHFGIALDG
ncbi:hypothetical protein PENTCL1PPCAC_29424, partial [Pristionchus entomophagus]